MHVMSRAGRLFDSMERSWESFATQRRVASALVIVFVVGLALVGLRRFGWVSPEITARLPAPHHPSSRSSTPF